MQVEKLGDIEVISLDRYLELDTDKYEVVLSCGKKYERDIAAVKKQKGYQVYILCRIRFNR